MSVILDPGAEYSGDPDYDDWAKGKAGISSRINVGFLYENKLFSQYKDAGLVPSGFTPAGANNATADLKLFTNQYHRGQDPKFGKDIGIELKVNADADFGQASLKHSGGQWYLDGKNTTEAIEMRKQLSNMNVISDINMIWKAKPKLFNYAKSTQVSQADASFDLENFKSSYITGSKFLNAFAAYYSSKNIHYIQIGGYGLYSLNSDPNNLSIIGVKPISQSGASMKLRIRTKTEGGKNGKPFSYRFSTALMLDRPPRPSGFDLDDPLDTELLQEDAMMCDNALPELVRRRALPIIPRPTIPFTNIPIPIPGLPGL